MTTEETEVMTATNEVVRIVAVGEKYRKAPIFLSPIFDEARKEFVVSGTRYKAKKSDNDDKLWEAEINEVHVTNYDSYEISDKMTLRLSDSMDKFIYSLIIDTGSGYIAKSKKDINPGYHRLYIENREAEAEESINEIDDMFTAADLIKTMRETELRELARVLMVHEKNISSNVVKSNIFKVLKTTPRKVLNVLNSASYKAEAMRSTLIHGKVISKTTRGYFTVPEGGKGEGEFLAFTDAEMSSYLLNKKNAKAVEQWVLQAKRNLKEETASE
jgi:hypothetical protein